MMSNSAPLISRQSDAQLAWLPDSASPLIQADLFLSHVKALASNLPDKQYVINLCDSRYWFLVSLCSAVLRKQTNLLPSNKNISTQSKLQSRYSDVYIVHDGVIGLDDNIPQIDLSTFDWPEKAESFDVPEVNLEHLAVISFTSGSTGDAKPNKKLWKTLVDSTAINVRYMLPNASDTFFHLATVPGQHMWGLETSVLMALFSNVCLVDARPLFPHDIINALEALPERKTLITTPLHLRALNAMDKRLPKLSNVLAATAPLDAQLAKDIEHKFDCVLREVYGCSEVGSMAVRRTTESNSWEKFTELEFSVVGEKVSVSANHLPVTVTLEDQLKMIDEDHFELLGRSADQVNIGGKRGSLAEINKVLLTFPGIVDGVVFFPEGSSKVPRLAALVVFAEQIDINELKAHFRNQLDAVFVPRPIIQVENLPREENGKLIKEKLLAFYKQLKS